MSATDCLDYALGQRHLRINPCGSCPQRDLGKIKAAKKIDDAIARGEVIYPSQPPPQPRRE